MRHSHSSVLSYGDKQFSKINIDRLQLYSRSWLERPQRKTHRELKPQTLKRTDR